MATISKSQLDELKSIAKEHQIKELLTIVKSLRKQIGSIKIKCPQHDKTVLVHDNPNVHIHGYVEGKYGISFTINELITLKEWTNTFNTIINTNPDFEFSCDTFGGKSPGSCFTVLEILKSCNVCCCPEKTHACSVLKLASTDLLQILELVNENDEDEDEDNNKKYGYDSDDSTTDKKDTVKYTMKDSTLSFRHFINRITKIPQRELENHNRVDITKFL